MESPNDDDNKPGPAPKPGRTHTLDPSDPLVTRLEAAAFRSLVEHLRLRSDDVSNMELMTTAGFCRNCLAKWMVLGARRMAREQQQQQQQGPDETGTGLSAADARRLDSFGYDEAAQLVYGTSYDRWKERHHREATGEQLERYRASAGRHAVHDEPLLRAAAGRAAAGATSPPPADPKQGARASAAPPVAGSSILSDVCCEDVEEVAAAAAAAASGAAAAASGPSGKDGGPSLTRARSLLPAPHPFATPPPLPAALLARTSPLRIGVLAASDRASRGEYPDGDLSTPAVVRQVQLALQEFACPPPSVVAALVPDEADQITRHLLEWSEGGEAVDVILTTGGTGFAPRDVTPEATKAVLDTELGSLMPLVLQAAAINTGKPLATLSRATAGIRNQTVVANLPGNPTSIEEILPVLFPQLVHALVDVRGW